MEKRKNDFSKKAEEFLRVFKKGEEFTQELLKENERLRLKLIKLEEEQNGMAASSEDQDIEKLRKRLAEVEGERTRLVNRFKEVEEENKKFALRYIEVEEENNSLANLYVASHQLHASLDFREVVHTINDILINLIGAERFAILLLEENAPVLSKISSEGLEEEEMRKVPLGEGIIGETVKSGECYFEADLSHLSQTDPTHPVAAVPLQLKDRAIGVIVILSLLDQKKAKFSRMDEELLIMLAGHATTAIFSSKLYSASERKLSTMQGFIDLLKQSQEGGGPTDE
ncbi:MAG: GAF domain-containing protein [Nitrospiria bacterium]